MKSTTLILLRTNRRVGVLGIAVCAVCCIVLSIATVCISGWLVRSAIGALCLTSLAALLVSLRFCWLPRLALENDQLLAYIGWSAKPVRIPLEIVEVFFIGQGPVVGSNPAQTNQYRGAVAANVIVRIAESAANWQTREVNPWLAVWNGGYITVRGLWCENLHQDRLKAMNRALMDAKRHHRHGGSSGGP